MIRQLKAAPWWVKVVLGGVSLFVVLAIIGAAMGDDDNAPVAAVTGNTDVANATNAPAATSTTVPALPPNQKKIGNLLLTVNGVEPYADDLFPAEPGTHYVAVDVTAQNVGDKEYALNANNFRLQDSDNFTTGYAISNKEPIIGHHTLVPGQTVRAFLVFKIGDGRTPSELQYQSFTGTPGTIPIP